MHVIAAIHNATTCRQIPMQHLGDVCTIITCNFCDDHFCCLHVCTYVYIAEQVHLDLFGCSDIITDICLVSQAMYCSLVWSIFQGLGQLQWITPSHPPILLQCVLMGMLSTMLMVLMYQIVKLSSLKCNVLQPCQVYFPRSGTAQVDYSFTPSNTLTVCTNGYAQHYAHGPLYQIVKLLSLKCNVLQPCLVYFPRSGTAQVDYSFTPSNTLTVCSNGYAQHYAHGPHVSNRKAFIFKMRCTAALSGIFPKVWDSSSGLLLHTLQHSYSVY